jgi:hypothetical protein
MVLGVEPGPLADGLILSHNAGRPGEVQVALAAALPIEGPGVLLRARLGGSDPAQPLTVIPAWGQADEGAVPLRLAGGQPALRLYLPVVTR